jgi:glyoxylase-like metal-dependent hydrolase (beta-lactamase superfamily II)
LLYPLADAEPPAGGTMEVAPGVRWLRIAVPGRLRHVNCWLLDEENGVTLVDTGMNTPEARDAWKAVFRGELAGVRVTRVIGTHFHPDHIGLAGWMCAHHDAPLLMTRTEWLYARMLIADARDSVPAQMVAFWRGAGWNDEQLDAGRARGWAGFRRIVASLPMGFSRLVDGQMLAIGTREWRIVTGSGHSPEHACLLDERGGVLIAGDQVLPRISPNVSVTVSETDADPLGEWFASIDKLHALPDDLLVLPGHGDPFTGLHARLDAMADEHRERLDALHVYLSEPRRAVDAFSVLFRRTVGQDMLGMATGEALAHLRRLQREGRAAHEDCDGVRWWFAV